MPQQRKPFSVDGLVQRSTSGTCFVCAFNAGDPAYHHEMVAQTPHAIAFLDKFPTVFGRVIVAPKTHLEQVTADFSRDEYLALQSFIYDVSEAMREVLAPERIYVLSLGSQAANAHVHWHIVPLPYGVPLQQQQYHSLMHEHGAVAPTQAELTEYVEALQRVFARSGRFV